MYETQEDLDILFCRGSEILSERPEIADKSTNEVLDMLNDGTQEMVHHRWGVAALVFVSKITDYSYEGLTRLLSASEIPAFLCGKVFYLLQRNKNIRCVKFMTAAKQAGVLERILPYVSHNFVFDAYVEEADIAEFIDLLDNIPQHNVYGIQDNFARRIVRDSLDGYALDYAMSHLTDAGIDFLSQLMNAVYEQDSVRGDGLLEQVLTEPWEGKLLGVLISGLNTSLKYDATIFEKYFETIAGQWNDSDTRRMLVPCYVRYAILIPVGNMIRARVMDGLREIISGDNVMKRIFIDSVTYRKDAPSDLEDIVNAISDAPFDKDADMLRSLTHYWYVRKKESVPGELLWQLQRVFLINRYNSKDKDAFFQVIGELLTEGFAQLEAWDCFFDSILKEGDGNLLFAVGLFDHILVTSTADAHAERHPVSENAAILVVKIIALFTFAADSIVQFAFSIIGCIDDMSEAYIDACMAVVYREYPGSSYAVAAKYISSPNIWQKTLAERIYAQYETDGLNQSAWRNVPDLYPSDTRLEIYRRAQMELNQRINREAQKHSFFAQLFPSRKMKYGRRLVHIRELRSGEYGCQTSDYVTCSHSFEMPSSYVNSPVTRHIRMNEVLEERRSYIAAHN